MNNDIDKIFREKNREILINSLKYDLEKNTVNLLDTISNIFRLEYDTAIRNIVTILEDANVFNSSNVVSNIISEMRLNNYNHVDELVKNKKDILENEIDNLEFKEDEMNKYYDKVFKTTKEFKELLNAHLKEVFENSDVKLDMYIVDSVLPENMEMANMRVSDYLKNRLCGKIETKIHMEVMIRDNNLINKAKESYLRYQEITSRTVKE